MLTVEEKNALIDQRIRQYEIQIFCLEMDRRALESIGDEKGIESINVRIHALGKAIEAVKGMKEYASTRDTRSAAVSDI